MPLPLFHCPPGGLLFDGLARDAGEVHLPVLLAGDLLDSEVLDGADEGAAEPPVPKYLARRATKG